ncbi:MFS transporter [Phytohabitans houttuyneae]|uniref:MFS transporter n=1 Tax=Phytohabitans houttuyneae TaxID=1076126 RepID=A0A6V8K0G9_9ACTN|nr:MFS transporter [Phytohabitans houttuyneae]GFJ77144.1 MFS transporter [Phytohabitans houttuyneae]
MATPSRARWAITAVFGGNGLLIASLVVRTPQLKLDLDLSPAQLGLVSAVFGVSAVLAMQVAGALAARVGSGWVVRAAILVLPVGIAGIGAAPTLAVLLALLLGFGAAHGLLDVSMNAHAVAVERALGRPIMNGCHAAWSIGAVVGSLAGSAAAQGGMSRQLHYAVLAVALLPAALACGRLLLPGHADRRAASPARARASWRAGWSRRIVAFGAMGATVLTVEAAVANWSGVYLHENLGASLGAATLGYVAFTACQTAGRLVGDRIQARASASRLVAAGTLVGSAGLAVVVLSPWPALAVAGFAVVGIGLATPLPVLFGVVGHLGASGAGAATTVARFSTMTYTGILIAPAIIGWVTELIGLTWTLATLIPLLALVARAAAPTISPTPARAPEPAVA